MSCETEPDRQVKHSLIGDVADCVAWKIRRPLEDKEKFGALERIHLFSSHSIE